MRPNFFIVGAPKCGTTSMYHYLRQHPQIFMPWDASRFWLYKEPNHFNDDLAISDSLRIAGEEDYLALFQAGNGQRRVGESTSFYLYSKVASKNIRRFAPDSKIIIMIRNPIDLVHSWHGDCLRWGHENVTDFMEAFHADPQREAGERIPVACGYPELLVYRNMGRMADGIQRFYESFDRGQVLVLTLDDLKEDAAKVFDRVLHFLEVDREFSPNFEVHNPRKKLTSAFVRSKRLWIRYLDLTKGARFLPSRVPSFAKPLLENAFHRVSKQLDSGNLIETDRSYLFPFFEEDIAKTEDLIHRDLSHWRVAKS